MDPVFIGNNIPAEYHYALFGNGYIDLYNSPVLQNDTYDYYRIYTNTGGFYYSHNTQRYGLTATQPTLVGVSNMWYYRTDRGTILFFFFVIVLFTIWFVNLFTSIFKKGGLLGGLF